MCNITKKEFLETAPEVLKEAGVKDDKVINALMMLTLKLEYNNHMPNKLQEL